MRIMRYRNLGGSGLRVSVIGLGTWQFGGEWGRAFSQAEVDAILDQGAALGINLIDTAECYGDHLAESLVGDYLARRDRSRWIVATKFGHHFNKFMDRTDAFSPAEARRQLEGSLRALRVEKIDLYQFHSGPDAAFLNEELWTALAEEKRAGKIGHLGVSIMQKGSETQAREARPARGGGAASLLQPPGPARRADVFPGGAAGWLGRAGACAAGERFVERQIPCRRHLPAERCSRHI
jgi:myo-inositol catabolism protein IolS